MGKRWTAPSLAALVLCATPALAEKPGEIKKNDPRLKAAPRVTDTPEFKMAVWRTINGSGPQFDRCTEQYLKSNPDADGKVAVDFELAEDGSIKKSRATSGLKGQDNLINCVNSVVRRWKFPKIGPNTVSSKIQITVAQGVKFRMLKPGEKRPPPRKNSKSKKREGFVDFSPSFFKTK